MYFVQLKVDFRGFSWFCKVLGAPAGPAGPEPPEASRAAAEQSLSEDLEDFLSSEQGFGRFFQAQSKELEGFPSLEQGFGRFFKLRARSAEDFNRIY